MLNPNHNVIPKQLQSDYKLNILSDFLKLPLQSFKFQDTGSVRGMGVVSEKWKAVLHSSMVAYSSNRQILFSQHTNTVFAHEIANANNRAGRAIIVRRRKLRELW